VRSPIPHIFPFIVLYKIGICYYPRSKILLLPSLSEEGTEGETRPPLGGEGPPQRKHHRVSRTSVLYSCGNCSSISLKGRGVIKSAQPSLSEGGTEGETRPPLGGEGPPQRKHHRVSRTSVLYSSGNCSSISLKGRGVIKSAQNLPYWRRARRGNQGPRWEGKDPRSESTTV
jgi:hypothetical protein